MMPEQVAEKLGVELVDVVKVALGDRLIPLPLVKIEHIEAVVTPGELTVSPVPPIANVFKNDAMDRRMRSGEIARRARDHTACVSVYSDQLKHVWYDRYMECLYAAGIDKPVEVRSIETITGADDYLSELVQAVVLAAAPRPQPVIIRFRDQPQQPHALPDDHSALMAYAKIRDQQAQAQQLQQQRQMIEFQKRAAGVQHPSGADGMIAMGRRMNHEWKADVPGLRFNVPKVKGIGYGPAKSKKSKKGGGFF